MLPQLLGKKRWLVTPETVGSNPMGSAKEARKVGVLIRLENDDGCKRLYRFNPCSFRQCCTCSSAAERPPQRGEVDGSNPSGSAYMLAVVRGIAARPDHKGRPRFDSGPLAIMSPAMDIRRTGRMQRVFDKWSFMRVSYNSNMERWLRGR
jgi:hypothetical protein